MPNVDNVMHKRVYIFVDFWNLSLGLNSIRGSGFKLDWGNRLKNFILDEASKLLDCSCVYQGMFVCGSYDLNNANDKQLCSWAQNKLSKFPGVTVLFKERQAKRSFLVCPKCHAGVEKCPKCGGDMRGTVEKGVDTQIAVEMMSMAWNAAYDVAVLVSDDKDFIPVAEQIMKRGLHVIHGRASLNGGRELDKFCFGSIEIGRNIDKIER